MKLLTERRIKAAFEKALREWIREKEHEYYFWRGVKVACVYAAMLALLVWGLLYGR